MFMGVWVWRPACWVCLVGWCIFWLRDHLMDRGGPEVDSSGKPLHLPKARTLCDPDLPVAWGSCT